MDLPWWSYAISMPLYFVFLLWVVDYFRKHPKASAYFWLATLLTFPLWIITGGVDGWFRWFKILSVILPTIVVGLARLSVYENRTGRFWDTVKKPGFVWFFYGILFLNIAEATVKDIQLANYPNAIVGLILCATIPFVPKYWTIERTGGADLIAYTTLFWNLLYTSWNAAFVYGETPKYFASSVVILLAAEIYPLIKNRPELYVIARVYTLAAHLLLRACLDFFPNVMDASRWHNESVLKWWGILNLVGAVPFLFWHMWQLDSGKAEKSFRHGRDPEAEPALSPAPAPERDTAPA